MAGEHRSTGRSRNRQRYRGGAADGLDDIRRIIAAAPAHLQPGGHLWLEHGYDQGAAVRDLLGGGGFTGTRTVRDLVVGSELRFVDRGERDLKGVTDRWHLFAVER